MSSNTIFLLDTNVIIEAHRRYYSFDFAPVFWNHLVQQAKAGRVVSIDRVRDEINDPKKKDPLSIWANSEFNNWFISTNDKDVFEAYSDIISWGTSNPQFLPAAQAEFASVADSWLVACAKAYNYTVVTQEVYSPHIKNKIKIPNACQAFGVPYVDTFQMLRELKVRFE